jgi:hypothetical protein
MQIWHLVGPESKYGQDIYKDLYPNIVVDIQGTEILPTWLLSSSVGEARRIEQLPSSVREASSPEANWSLSSLTSVKSFKNSVYCYLIFAYPSLKCITRFPALCELYTKLSLASDSSASWDSPKTYAAS